MPTYEIELLWQCPSCTDIVAGMTKTCPNCGNFRTEKEEDIWPNDLSQANAIRDLKKIAAARSGADWKCAYCKGSQRRLDGRCVRCGSERREGREVHQERKIVKTDLDTNRTFVTNVREPVGSDALVEVEPSEHPDPFPSPKHEADPFAAERDPFPKRVREPRADTPVSADLRRALRPSFVKRAPYAVVASLAMAFTGLFLWWLLHTRVVDVAVADTHWQRTVHVERYSIYRHESFEYPNDAFDIENLGERVHHYDHVLVGHHTEHYSERVACGEDCTTPSCYTTPRNCTSNKNGSATCTGGDTVCPSRTCTTRYCNEDRTRTVDDYEDQPRYRMYHGWKRWEWQHNRDAVTAGSVELKVVWPNAEDLHLGRGLGAKEQERESGREEQFSVKFSGDDDTWTYAPACESEFVRFTMKSSHRIRVNHAGSIEVLRPGQEP
jgi:hypothetical protein